MKIYKNQNVYDAALERIGWIFDEFRNVVVGISGGKDSTVIFHLALQVAREKGRLPLRVMFIDQEAEWEATIDQIRRIMYHPDVEPYWYQMPIRLFNATSASEHWLYCWAPEDEDRWMREKDPISIKENTCGEDRFAKLFAAILKEQYPDEPAIYISGVRTEESPTRFHGLTAYATYKGETWGSIQNGKLQHYTMYPIYDWSYSDVWKAIHDNGWPYNRIYDVQYQYGYHAKDMRVSNVHHETAVQHLFYMQEIEPETYERLAHRIKGIDTAGKMGKADYFPKELPFMFKDWREYRDYLLENLWEREDWKRRIKTKFAEQERAYLDALGDRVFKLHIKSILTNDWEGIKLANFDSNFDHQAIRRRARGEKVW